MSLPLPVGPPRTPPEWAAYFALRYAVLRQPWQQPPGSERCPEDEQASTVHALLLAPAGQAAAPEALAVGMLHPGQLDQGQIRYMAVAASAAGSGLGSLVVQYLEQQARATGLRELVLHSRESAVGFYERHDYTVEAPSHLLFGVIPHFLMRKQL